MATTLIEQTFEVGGVKVTITGIPAHAEGGRAGVDAKVMEQVVGQVAHALASRGVINGASFRYLRRALGLRAADVSQLLDVRQATISDWETGKFPVDRAAWGLLAAAVLRGAEALNALRPRSAPEQPISEALGAT